MMKPVQIRKMEEGDLEQVARIEAENFSVPWKEKDFHNYLDDPQALFLSAVVQTGGKEQIAGDKEQTAGGKEQTAGGKEQIVGYIGCLFAADEGDITNVSVDRTCRRCGIGRTLVQTLLQAAEQRGCARVFLEVRQSNDAAIRLYSRFGFTEIGLRRNYYTKPEEDAVLMRHGNEQT